MAFQPAAPLGQKDTKEQNDTHMSLTNEDKVWIESLFSEKLGRVETIFSEKLERVEATLTEKIALVETTFNDKLERVETALLTAFHKWASPAEARFRSHSNALTALDLEIEATKDRVASHEQRLQRPPQ